MRRLIINADDFGLTSGVNRAIAEAAACGIVTSTTLMANSRAFDDAVRLAQAIPRLGVGCHVVLVDGQPLSTGPQTLLESGQDFYASLNRFALAAVRNKISTEEIHEETAAQICKMQSSGMNVTHVDSHKHTHLFPQVLRPILRAAKACGVRAVRNPFEPLRSWFKGTMQCPPGLRLRNIGATGLRVFARAFEKAITEEGFLTTDGTLGIAVTGKLDQKALTWLLQSVPDGTYELVCHPGYVDAELQSIRTRLLQSRETELQALTSAETKQVLARQKITLISYADLS